jgi:RNA-directed DNA polymerase
MQHAANVTAGDPLDWHAMEWKRVSRHVKNLRQRLFRASRDGDLQHVRSLQRLMRRSRANVWESVRRVTQVHHGKSTPGIDQVVVTTPEARGALCTQLSHLDRHMAHPVRRVSIPRRKGTRPRGIPTLVDRGVQAMVNNALEPFWAARVEGMSDGFRPGRGCHDAIQTICCVARPNTTRPWVVDADLEGAFDHIGHAALLQAMGNFPARGLLQQWLKAGYMEEKRLHPTEPGVPQGGVISPWLLTVALHGMEHARGRSSTPRGTRRGAYALGRYAADLPVFCPTQEEAIEAKALLAQWLRTRGWRRSEAKTPIRPLTEGVTFLGFNSRHDPAPQRSRSGVKLLMNPSQDSIQRIQRPLKGLWRTPVDRRAVLVHEERRGFPHRHRDSSIQQTCLNTLGIMIPTLQHNYTCSTSSRQHEF